MLYFYVISSRLEVNEFWTDEVEMWGKRDVVLQNDAEDTWRGAGEQWRKIRKENDTFDRIIWNNNE